MRSDELAMRERFMVSRFFFFSVFDAVEIGMGGIVRCGACKYTISSVDRGR